MSRPATPVLPEDVPGADRLPPGAARCPAPSFQQLIAADPNPAPPVLTHQHYEYLGSEDVDYARYYDRAHFEAEVEKVWKRTWQWACREEHIPEPGDYYVYEIAELSIIVVRQQDGGIKAFWNSCLHRGTKLRSSEGAGHADELRCKFHGWSWHPDGRLKNVPCAWDFPQVKSAEFALPEVRVATWGGFVFLNPDPRAMSLEQYLGVVPEHFARWDLRNRYVEVYVAKELPCNWKAALEAFLEAYHVLETHPQLMYGVADANVQYDIYGDHVARFVSAAGVPSPHLTEPVPDQEIVRRMIVGNRGIVDESLKVGEGETARMVMARFLRKALGQKYRTDLSRLSDSEIIDTIHYNLFPNTVLHPGASLPMVYRFRPLGRDPDRALFEILYLRPLPATGERPAPAEPYRLGESDSYTTVPGLDAGLGAVYDQDTDNLRDQQRGFRTSFKRGQTLGNYQEIRARHFERTIDRYLARD